jgi:hypothetical protein
MTRPIVTLLITVKRLKLNPAYDEAMTAKILAPTRDLEVDALIAVWDIVLSKSCSAPRQNPAASVRARGRFDQSWRTRLRIGHSSFTGRG